MYQYKPTTKKRTPSAKKALKPGNYISEVLKVSFDDDYAFDSMLLILYRLTTEEGEVFSYQERFHNSEKNPRTRAFFEYLEENGVKDIFSDFVGARENVVVKKVPQENGKVFMNIVQRDFVDSADC